MIKGTSEKIARRMKVGASRAYKPRLWPKRLALAPDEPRSEAAATSGAVRGVALVCVIHPLRRQIRELGAHRQPLLPDFLESAQVEVLSPNDLVARPPHVALEQAE